MKADVLQAGNTAEPMANGVYEFKECRDRMPLDVRRTNCKLIGTFSGYDGNAKEDVDLKMKKKKSVKRS